MDKTLLGAIVEGQNITISLNAADLKEVINDIVITERTRAQEEQRRKDEHATLTRKETAARLKVTTNTLHRWAKSGYLVPVKVGVRTLYKASDVEDVLTHKRTI